MRSAQALKSPVREPDLVTALGPEGELEYAQLASFIRDATGGYVLLPVRSDFDTRLRDDLLASHRQHGETPEEHPRTNADTDRMSAKDVQGRNRIHSE